MIAPGRSDYSDYIVGPMHARTARARRDARVQHPAAGLCVVCYSSLSGRAGSIDVTRRAGG